MMRMTRLPDRHTLTAYVLELLIVIFGITVAFQIEKLDDNRREAEAHETLRRGLMSEIDLNLQELTKVLQRGEGSRPRSSQVLELLLAEDRSATPELATALGGLAQLSLPEIQSGQLNAYVASDLAATSTARPALIELSARLQELDEVGTYRTNYMLERFLPLVSPAYDFAEGRIMDPDAVWGFQMRNAVGLLVSLEQSHQVTQRTAFCSLIRARDALIAAGAHSGPSDVQFDYEECRGGR